MSLSVNSLQSEPATQRALDGSTVAGTILVSVAALAVVSYLIFDWLKSRRETRKFELKRQRARESWKHELEDLRSKQQPPPPGAAP